LRLSSLFLGTDTRWRFCEQAIYLFAWDYNDLRESKNAVKLFLDELGSHVPMASVIFCSIHSAGFDEEVMDDHDREITEVKRKVFHTNHNLASRMPT